MQFPHGISRAVLLWSPLYCTAPRLRYRPAGLPGLRDLPLLILAVEHGADAVRVLGPQLHGGNTESRPAPARTRPAPGPGPGGPAAPGRTCCARSWRRSFCRSRISCSRLFMAAAAPAPRSRRRRRRHFPSVTSVPRRARGKWRCGQGPVPRALCQGKSRVRLRSAAAGHGPPLQRQPVGPCHSCDHLSTWSVFLKYILYIQFQYPAWLFLG